MHHCPECVEVCSCHHDTDYTMREPPADCDHACGEDEQPPQLPKRRWPWSRPEMQGEKDRWPC